MNCRSGSFFPSGRNTRRRLVFSTGVTMEYSVQIHHCESLVSQYSTYLAECISTCTKCLLVHSKLPPDKAEFQDETLFLKEARCTARGQATTTWPVSNHRPLVGIKVHTFCGDGSFPRCLILPDYCLILAVLGSS